MPEQPFLEICKCRKILGIAFIEVSAEFVEILLAASVP